MRKIIATEFYTLDGFMSDPEDKMEWVLEDFDPELGKYEDELYDGADTLMLGRVTYKIWEGFWPKVKDGEDAEMAGKINAARKIVFSKTIDSVEWENSQLLNEIDAAEIEKIKNEDGKNILVVGSATIVQQFSQLGLIDEYHFAVHPVILGTGKPLFKNGSEMLKLELFDHKIFKNGVTLLKYRPFETVN